MIVQKFGGTSVGDAQRIRHVASLISSVEGPNMVVLSAVSGTTNALSEIVDVLYRGEKEQVKPLVASLRVRYLELIDGLFEQQKTKDEAAELLESHWNHIASFTLDMFTRFEERTILAQGELISTMLMKL